MVWQVLIGFVECEAYIKMLFWFTYYIEYFIIDYFIVDLKIYILVALGMYVVE